MIQISSCKHYKMESISVLTNSVERSVRSIILTNGNLLYCIPQTSRIQRAHGPERRCFQPRLRRWRIGTLLFHNDSSLAFMILGPYFDRHAMDGIKHRSIANAMTKLVRRYLLHFQNGFVFTETRPSQLLQTVRQSSVQFFSKRNQTLR